MSIDKRTASDWMDAFVAMWTSVNDERRRYRDAIENAIKRLDNDAPGWEVASRLRTALEALDPASAFVDRGTTNPVTDERVQRAAHALAAEVGEEDVDDAITQLGYLESARKALTAALCPASTSAPKRSGASTPLTEPARSADKAPIDRKDEDPS